MKAAVLHHPGPSPSAPLVLCDRSVPSPEPSEVSVRVEACGVCRTDLQLVEGDLALHRCPVVPGHQAVGVVEAVGARVTGVQVGQRVGVAWIASTCGRCRYCTAGLENLCEDATFTGWDVDGGFAERLIARGDFVHPLPPTGDPVALAPLLCGGAIGYRCLHVAEVEPGSRLGLYGFGASATIVIQMARHLGCEVHVCTRSAAERRRALDLGAAWVGGDDERPPVALDAAITFAPSGDVVVAALKSVRRGGIVAVNAIHLDRIPEFPYELLWWERQLRSVANVTRDDVRGLLRLAVEIPLRTEVVRYPLARVNDALVDLAEGRVRGAAVLDLTGSAAAGG
jgi:propanol-preferring alcohol dehydrogenase